MSSSPPLVVIKGPSLRTQNLGGLSLALNSVVNPKGQIKDPRRQLGGASSERGSRDPLHFFGVDALLQGLFITEGVKNSLYGHLIGVRTLVSYLLSVAYKEQMLTHGTLKKVYLRSGISVIGPFRCPLTACTLASHFDFLSYMCYCQYLLYQGAIKGGHRGPLVAQYSP